MLTRDTFLFLRLRRGDPSAYDAVVQAHYASVYRQHFLLCLNRDRAADLTQETFVEAWRSLPGFASRADVRTWLYRIAVRVWQRKMRVEVRLPLTVPDDTAETVDTADGPETLALEHLRSETVWCALEKLSPDMRAVVVLHYEQQLSLRELAAALDIPVGTAKSRLNAGLRHLRRLLSHLEENL